MRELKRHRLTFSYCFLLSLPRLVAPPAEPRAFVDLVVSTSFGGPSPNARSSGVSRFAAASRLSKSARPSPAAAPPLEIERAYVVHSTTTRRYPRST